MSPHLGQFDPALRALSIHSVRALQEALARKVTRYLVHSPLPCQIWEPNPLSRAQRLAGPSGIRSHSARIPLSPDPTQPGSHSARIPLSPDPSLTERCGIEPHGAVRLTILGRPPEGRVDQVCAFLIWIKPHLPNTFLIWIRSVAPLSE